MWPGQTAFILGGGPTLKETDLSLIHHRRVIGVNNAYQLGSWIDICWFGDNRWHGWHAVELRSFPGLIVTCAPGEFKANYVHQLKRGKSQGIDPSPRCVAWNRQSGASAINLAYHLGAATVVLIGFDMRRVSLSELSSNQDGTVHEGTVANWHEDHPAKQKDPYDRFSQVFKVIARDARKLGLEIVNCTPGSAIKEFPIMDLKDFLKKEDDPDHRSDFAKGEDKVKVIRQGQPPPPIKEGMPVLPPAAKWMNGLSRLLGDIKGTTIANWSMDHISVEIAPANQPDVLMVDHAVETLDPAIHNTRNVLGEIAHQARRVIVINVEEDGGIVEDMVSWFMLIGSSLGPSWRLVMGDRPSFIRRGEIRRRAIPAADNLLAIAYKQEVADIGYI